jgi:hypothetical protein
MTSGCLDLQRCGGIDGLEIRTLTRPIIWDDADVHWVRCYGVTPVVGIERPCRTASRPFDHAERIGSSGGRPNAVDYEPS